MSTQANSDTRTRISIILPVYNVAEFLPQCLQSIVDQSPEFEFEALLIDDCSTDHSRSICNDYAGRHPQLFSLLANPDNRGVSATRNLGLDNARGDYFMFVDPDDLLAPGALATLYAAATGCDADIVKGNNTIFRDGMEKAARYNVRRRTLVAGDAVLATLYAHEKVRGHPWGKLFNRARLGHLRFPVGVRMAQDLYYCGEVFAGAGSLLLIEQTVYRYRLRPGGSTGRKFETGAYLDWLQSVEDIGHFARNRHQARIHRGLQLRTLVQIARECRAVDTGNAVQVLRVIEQKRAQWKLGLTDLLLRHGLRLRDLTRYVRLRLALREVRARLSRAEA
jgi:glycosyltransferase involved in cell wall biosynthesis